MHEGLWFDGPVLSELVKIELKLEPVSTGGARGGGGGEEVEGKGSERKRETEKQNDIEGLITVQL